MTQEQLIESNKSTCTAEEIEAGKSTAIIAHITLIGLIIAFILNNDKKNTFSAYHIRQVLGLAVTGLALMAISIIPVLGWLMAMLGYILLLIMWVAGIINAVNGKEKPMPVLGKQYMQWFKGV